MNRKNFILYFSLILVILNANLFGQYNEGEVYHGFKLLEKRFIKEVNSDGYYFEHIKSGAKLFKLAAKDQNKTFSIAFKTLPQSDYGTPHIIEHSVLNGSTNFPVKSPFDVLEKGSLQTFLNAFTGSDFTMYPAASMNDKDYFNLMHIYLDAVFNPLIAKDKRIFKQEGWHYELENKDSAISYKGVVYNEMKGAFSTPTRELNYQMFKNLFPDNSYKFSSGGYPSTIPKLKYEDFLDYYKRFYHPSNSYIFLYGDADLDKELSFIDSAYLSSYEKKNPNSDIPLQKPFSEMKEINAFYSASEGSSTENQTYLNFSFVAGLNTDKELVMALDILSDVLVNQESAPLRLALKEAGIGKDVSANTDNIEQNVFSINVQNANPGDKEKFKNIVFNTLAEVVKNGLDKQAVEGAINRMEFGLREGNDAQKGVNYGFNMLSGWFFASNPFIGLEYEKPLAELKTGITKKYLEDIIKKYMLDNQHKLLITLEPKPGLEKENNEKIDGELKAYKSSLSESDIQKLTNDTKELIDFQKREDSPEALAKIPLLSIKDINPKAEWYDLDEKKCENIPVLFHNEYTNGVTYLKIFFNIKALPSDLIPYAALLAEAMGSMNTEHYSYGDLDKVLNINTGGFSTYLTSYLKNMDDANLLPKFVVSSKVMNDKIDKVFELAAEVITKTKYADKERLKEVLLRYQSRLESNIKSNGFGYTQTRLSSYFTKQGMFSELTNGIDYYRFISNLANNYDSKYEEISANLLKIEKLLINTDNMIISITCNKTEVPECLKNIEKFSSLIPTSSKSSIKEPDHSDWNISLDRKNEGFLTSSKVQYVLEGYDYKKLGYKWTGKLRVLSQILSTDYLQTQLRVVGGAYGGWSSFSASGLVFLGSYRDPNLKKTLDNYNGIPEYLSKFEVDENAMTRYIIGTVAQIDKPSTPSQRGDIATRYYFQETTAKDEQQFRDEVLSTSQQDIRSMKKLMEDILAKKIFCVYGNEDKINAEKEVFNKIEKLDNK
jgi:presequence protease